MSSTAQLTQTLVDALNGFDASLIRTICSKTYQGYDASRESVQHGASGLMAEVGRLGEAFPDGRIQLVHQSVSGDSTGAVWIFKGTHSGTFLGIPATGRKVTVCGFSHLDFENGLLTRGLHLWDMAGLLRNLRLLPDLPDCASTEELLPGMMRALGAA